MKKNILLIIFIVLSICLGSFVVHDKVITKDNKQIEACDFKNGQTDEQMIYSKIGIIYISKKGDVYFDPSNSADIYGKKVDISSIAKKSLGNISKNEVKSTKFFEGKHTFDYKLELSNVKLATEFTYGNGGTNDTILFVHNDGSVSSFEYNNELILTTNIKEYKNIISVVIDQDEDGSGALLIDKCGNSFKYTKQD